MRYVGRQASKTNPLRSMLLTRPGCQVMPWTDRETAAFELSKARQALPRAEAYLPIAIAFLGKANASKKPMRRRWQADALRGISRARADLRSAQRALEIAEAAMRALDGDLFARTP